MTDMPIEHPVRGAGFASEGDASGSKPGIARETAWRSFAKAISWRVLGTLDTFFLSFMIIKFVGPLFGLVDEHSDLEIAATASLIAITEIATKIFIYTVHERLWNLVHWGVVAGHRVRHETRFRSFIKMSTWRVLLPSTQCCLPGCLPEISLLRFPLAVLKCLPNWCFISFTSGYG